MKPLLAALLFCFGSPTLVEAAGSDACATIATDVQDGVLVVPQNYKVLYETDDVRVIEVTVAPHTKELAHTNARPAVMYLDGPTATKMQYVGSTEVSEHPYDPNFKPIAIWTTPEGLHTLENTGDTVFHAIRVEFKHPGCALPGVATLTDAGPRDGVKVWPQGHRVLFDNAEVRVLDVHNAPHSKEPYHTHAWPGFFYVVQAVPMKYSTQDGAAPIMLGVPPIKIVPLPPNPLHSVENLGDQDAHFIRFELKLAAPPKSPH
jgi:hypothetical protein